MAIVAVVAGATGSRAVVESFAQAATKANRNGEMRCAEH
jgi:hypothetical protein